MVDSADNLRVTLPKTQNVVQIPLKSIKIPQILLDARAETLSALASSLEDTNFIDSNLAILYSTLKTDGIFVPIQVHPDPKDRFKYVLTEGLLRLKIFQTLYPKSTIPAVIVPYDANLLHRAFVGNMAREDYALPELASWINFLMKNGEDSAENRNSIHIKYHVPRSRIACALFSISPAYQKLLLKYPETSVSVLERISRALDPSSQYMLNSIAKSFVLDHLKNLEGQRVSKGFLDSLLYDALEQITDADTPTTKRKEETGKAKTKNQMPPPVFYREISIPAEAYERTASKIQKAIDDNLLLATDVILTLRISKEAIAKLTDRPVEEVNGSHIEDWLK
jgi:hypothetical protein